MTQMKTILIALVLLITTSAVQSQDDKYTNTMAKTIQELYANQDLNGFDAISNKFSRIGQAEKSKWEPFYYASLAQVFKSFRIEDLNKKDQVLDQSLELLKSAQVLTENNAEVIALEGFIYMIKIGVDPATRGQAYSPRIIESFKKAMAIDPDNPRATLFMGQMQVGTAQFFGSGIEQACALIQKSIQLFDSYEPAGALSPQWGKSSAMQYKDMCAGDKTDEID